MPKINPFSYANVLKLVKINAFVHNQILLLKITPFDGLVDGHQYVVKIRHTFYSNKFCGKYEQFIK